MESNNECFVCGGHDFVIADGAFICNECGIQSQNVREELINFNDNNMHGRRDDMFDKDHEITAGSQLEKNKKLLSWECFNLILIGLTNEMIELGAKPNLKVIVLQLWVRYLQCIEAAFTSKKCRKLPKLNTSFNNIDGEILYDIENLRKKLLYSKTGIWKGRQKPKKSNSRKSLTSCNSNANSTMTASQKQIRITHKLRRLDHSKTDINNDSTGFSNDVNLLQRKKNSRKINIKMSKNVQKSLKGMPSITKDLTFEESAKLFQSGRKCWDLLKHKEKKNMITMKKLISIIRIATMINNDDIYLSDIIRWIYEGHFPINRINLFLPENVVHGIGLRKFMLMSSRNQLNLEMTMLLIHFKADQLPNIDFKKMAVRFCDELQLPSDFTNFVCKLVSISPPSLCFTCVSPDTEIEVMAYLLFAAKFLFCLDGNAENLSSDFAEKVNRLDKKHHKLFSWNEYVKYIECRNTVVSDYNSVLHTKLYENKIHNTKLFIDNWNIIKSTLPLKDKTLSKKFRENTECLFKSLPDVGRNESYRAIPASTKPLSSTLKWILDYYPMQLSVVTKTTLEKNFTQTDILYLTNKERICDLANKYDIPIEINCNKPLYYQKQKKNSNTKLSVPNNTQVNLCLREQSTKQIQQTETFNTSYKEKPNTIYLGTGLYYWYIHFDKFFLRRADIVKINMVFKKKLPHSFYWFMHQCCRILDCAQSCLYLELLKLEKKFSVTLQSYDTSSDSEDEDSLSGRSESS